MQRSRAACRAARGTRPVSGVLEYAVSKSTGAQQTSVASGPPPFDRDARDDAIWRVERPLGAFWGLRYRKWKVGHLGLAAYRVKLLHGARPTKQRAHATRAPVTKPDHDMHGGPAGSVHIFINTKVTVSTCVLVCTQLTCQCETSDDCAHAFLQNMEAVVRAWIFYRLRVTMQQILGAALFNLPVA